MIDEKALAAAKHAAAQEAERRTYRPGEYVEDRDAFVEVGIAAYLAALPDEEQVERAAQALLEDWKAIPSDDIAIYNAERAARTVLAVCSPPSGPGRLTEKELRLCAEEIQWLCDRTLDGGSIPPVWWRRLPDKLRSMLPTGQEVSGE